MLQLRFAVVLLSFVFLVRHLPAQASESRGPPLPASECTCGPWGSCFVSPGTSGSWQDAKADCEARGGQLATITSEAENDAVFSVVQTFSHSEAWIGLHDVVHEGEFEWVDNKGLSFTAWDVGQPDDWQNNEDCVMMWSQKKWNDGDCSAPLPWVCELSCASEVVDNANSKKWRVVHSVPVTRVDAQAACWNWGGVLGTIAIQEDSDMILPLLDNRNAWIGLGRTDVDEVWGWEDHTMYGGWNNFAELEPVDNCAYVRMDWQEGLQGRWNDAPCDSSSFALECFVCSKPLRVPEAHVPSWCTSFEGSIMVGSSCFFAPQKPLEAFDDQGNHVGVEMMAKAGTWDEAEAICQSYTHSNLFRVELASIVSDTENDAVEAIKHALELGDVWLGITDVAFEGRFVWSDGTGHASPPAFWDVNEPNNAWSVEDCGCMWSNGKWNDRNCADIINFVCRAQAAAPCDAGGMVDGQCLLWVGGASVQHETAEQYCSVWGGKLANVGSKEAEWLQEQWHGNSVAAWVGLGRASSQDVWAFADGGVYDSDATLWHPSAEELLSRRDEAELAVNLCVVTQTSKWHLRTCDARPSAFVCGKREFPLVPPACIGDVIGGYCYWSPPHTYLDFYAARAACQQWGGTLGKPPPPPDPDTENVYNYWNSGDRDRLRIRDHFKGGWLGLHRAESNQLAVWAWEDGSFFDFAYFRKAVSVIRGFRCVYTSASDRHDGPYAWLTSPCHFRQMSFTCSRPMTTPAPNPNPDAELCDGGRFVQGKCWWTASGVALTHDEANAECRQWGGKLASFTSQQEARAVREAVPWLSAFYFTDKRVLYSWVGLRSLTREQLWAWEDGAPYRNARWLSYENEYSSISYDLDLGSTEQCAFIITSGEAEDIDWKLLSAPCATPIHNIICTKSPVQTFASISNPSFEEKQLSRGESQRGGVSGWTSTDSGLTVVEVSEGLSSSDASPFVMLERQALEQLVPLKAGVRYALRFEAARASGAWDAACAGVQVKAVRVWGGDVVDQIEFEYRDKSTWSTGTGIRSGVPQVVLLEVGEVIVSVVWQRGACTDGFKLVTNRRESHWLGGHGGGPAPTFEASANDPIVRFTWDGVHCNPLTGVQTLAEVGGAGAMRCADCGCGGLRVTVAGSGGAPELDETLSCELEPTGFRAFSLEFNARVDSEAAVVSMDTLDAECAALVDAVTLELVPPSSPLSTTRGTFSISNLARSCGGPCPARQSSTEGDWTAAKAVDGAESAASVAVKGYAATRNDSNCSLSWWRVDLGQERQVGLVKLWKVPGQEALLDGFEVRVGNADAPLGNEVAFRCRGLDWHDARHEYARVAASGRYLFVVRHAGGLAVAEVQVFAPFLPEHIAPTHAHYRAAHYRPDTRMLPDLSGNGRHSTHVVNKVWQRRGKTGFRNGIVDFLEGNDESGIVFPEGSVPENFTICTASRYTSTEFQGSIVDAVDEGGNWAFGHSLGHRASFFLGSLAASSQLHSESDELKWLVMCGNNAPGPHFVVADGEAMEVDGGGTGDQQLTINYGALTRSPHRSDWSVAEVVVWEGHLSLSAMVLASDYLTALLSNGAAHSPPDGCPHPGTPLPPAQQARLLQHASLALSFGAPVLSCELVGGDFNGEADAVLSGETGWSWGSTVLLSQANEAWGGLDSGEGEAFVGLQGVGKLQQTVRGMWAGGNYSLWLRAAGQPGAHATLRVSVRDGVDGAELASAVHLLNSEEGFKAIELGFVPSSAAITVELATEVAAGASHRRAALIDALSVVQIPPGRRLVVNGHFEAAPVGALSRGYVFEQARGWRGSAMAVVGGVGFAGAARRSAAAQTPKPALISQRSEAWGELSSADGSRFLGLAGAQRQQQQVHGLEGGRRYSLWFEAARRPWFAPPLLRVQVSAGGSVLEELKLKAEQLSDVAFQGYEVSFVPPSNNVTISFDTELSPASSVPAFGGVTPESTAFVDAVTVQDQAAIADGCDGGNLVEGLCYWKVVAQMDREQAQLTCEDWAGTLAVARSDATRAAVAAELSGDTAWLGLRKVVGPGSEWVWEDGVAVEEREWKTAPDESEECSVWDGEGVVGAACLETRQVSLCQRAPGERCEVQEWCEVTLADMGMHGAAIVHAECCRCCFYVEPGSSQLQRVGECDKSCSGLALNRRNLVALHPQVFANLPFLRVLDLVGNSLTNLPPAVFSGLPALRILRLADNRLAALPALASLPALTELSLRDNRISSIPAHTLSVLAPNVALLLLDGNRLTELELSGLPRLTYLDVSRNLLRWASIGPQLPQLSQLRMHDNSLLTLPTMAEVPALTLVSLKQNKMEVLYPNATDGLQGVISLDLSFNQLRSMQAGALDNLKNLVHLDLSFNALAWLRPGIFGGLAALVTLNLDHNPLECQPHTPQNLQHLAVLQLPARVMAGIYPPCYPPSCNGHASAMIRNVAVFQSLPGGYVVLESITTELEMFIHSTTTMMQLLRADVVQGLDAVGRSSSLFVVDQDDATQRCWCLGVDLCFTPNAGQGAIEDSA